MNGADNTYPEGATQSSAANRNSIAKLWSKV
jgi:hypothetical protein